MKYLLDASALYDIFDSGKMPLISDFAVLTLTKYEVGNVIWKKNRKKEIKDLTFVIGALNEFFDNANAIDIEFSEVAQVAVKRDISYYDAAYIAVAENRNLLLVTKDNEILKKSKQAISTEDAFK